MTKKNTTFALIGIAVIGGLIFFSNKNSAPHATCYENDGHGSTTKTTCKVSDVKSASPVTSTNAKIEGEKQIIELTAKGGYSPKITNAKAGVPTILRIKTNGTYDCSAALRIKSINYSKNLPATGTTDIEIPAQAAGSTLKALCSMGMYNFSVQFNS